MNIRSVLVVCTGNICRSPFAQTFLANSLPRLVVDSAGTHAPSNQPADSVVTGMAQEHGLDLSMHRSKAVSAELLHQHDLILVMENDHAQSVELYSPEVRGRVMLLGHWNNRREIPDPFQRSIDMYSAVFSQLIGDAQGWVRKLSHS